MNEPSRAVNRRTMLKLAAAAATGAACPVLHAQPELPALARILVGFPPGGAPDLVARRLADQFRGKLARSVIVENRPGAGGRIALDAARQLPPDGETLLLSPSGIVTHNPHTYRKLNYDPFKDLTPITMTHTVNIGFAVGPAVAPQVRDVAGFAAWVKEQAGSVSFGSPAAGAPPHFVGDWLSRRLNLGLTHVPYRGGAPAFNDLYGGTIAGLALTIGDFVQPAKAGRLRILATTGAKRSVFTPDVPTFEEQGIPGLDRDDWFGLYVAGQAAPEVVQRLSAITKEAMSDAAHQAAMRESFLEPAWSTPEELARRGREDHAHWAPIIKASGFTLDS